MPPYYLICWMVLTGTLSDSKLPPMMTLVGWFSLELWRCSLQQTKTQPIAYSFIWLPGFCMRIKTLIFIFPLRSSDKISKELITAMPFLAKNFTSEPTFMKKGIHRLKSLLLMRFCSARVTIEEFFTRLSAD